MNNIGTVDLFAFKLGYNEGTTPLYNGNISLTQWKTRNTDSSLKTYNYTYDALNRILTATDNTAKFNLTGLSYDKNGNIMGLIRQGQTIENPNLALGAGYGTMDNLVYAYDSGNKLLKVTDNANDTYGFKDGVNTGDDFTYDVNGNMLSDANKGITNITYNHLNLPTQVFINNPEHIGNISYIYDAVGTKLKKVVTDASSLITTEYAGNYVYENSVLQFFNHAEGYFDVTNTPPSGELEGAYVYQYKDHLGNVRLSYADADGNGVIAQTEIREENNYYPFGLKHKGYNNVVTSTNPALKYKYNGVEYEESLGLNMYEMDVRSYDPAIARFTGLDPVTHFDFSTYSAFDNNPVFWADPSGADAQSTGECSTCDVHGRQTIENGRYVTVSERRKREEKEGNAGINTSVNAENNQSVNINVADLKSSIDNELNIDKSDNIGEAIVKSFISNIILTIQLEVLIEIAISQKNYNFRGPKPFVAIPEFAVRVRNASGRNSTDENRNYGSVTFSNTFEVLSAVEGDQSGNYGYYYAAGTNVLSSSFKSDNLTYNDRNSFLETTFSGWAYIRFLDENRKKVGELLFRNTKLKDKFVNYFDVVLREKIRKKFAK